MGSDNFGMGALIVAAIGVIVGLILLGAASDQTAVVSNEYVVVNQSVTLAGLNVPVAITGIQGFGDTPTIINASTGKTEPAGGYVIGSNNGQATIESNVAGMNGVAVKVQSAKAQYFGYSSDSGTQIVSGLIVLFGALAVGMVALYPTLKSGVLDFI